MILDIISEYSLINRSAELINLPIKDMLVNRIITAYMIEYDEGSSSLLFNMFYG